MALLRDTDPKGRLLADPAIWLGSLFYSGFSPVMRGTAGSILTALVAWILLVYAGAGTPHWWLAAAVASAASYLLGIRALRLTDRPDPGWFVLDEAAGLFVTLGLIGAASPLEIGWGLVTFRVYDIAKPWPVRSFESLPGSLGILADDLAAGVFAGWTIWVMREAAPGLF